MFARYPVSQLLLVCVNKKRVNNSIDNVKKYDFDSQDIEICEIDHIDRSY